MLCAGTPILTQAGEIAVEALTPGDVVITRSGEEKTVTWTGGWQADPSAHEKPEMVWPIRILAGALGRYLPRRELYVSPDHSLYLAGVLVPAHLLVNGKTITQPARGGAVAYHHVQVEPHDILLAEGAAAESFLDLGRADFAKPGEEPRSWEDACAPIVLAGPQLGRIRRMLAVQAVELAGAVSLAA